MSTLFRWGFAQVGWKSPGHVLDVEHLMSDRALTHFAPKFEQWLAEKGWVADVDYVTFEERREQDGSKQSKIHIAAQGLLSWDANDLADAMDSLAADATRHVDEQLAIETPLADEFTRTLRARARG